jgi:hypothetical protein
VGRSGCVAIVSPLPALLRRPSEAFDASSTKAITWRSLNSHWLRSWPPPDPPSWEMHTLQERSRGDGSPCRLCDTTEHPSCLHCWKGSAGDLQTAFFLSVAHSVTCHSTSVYHASCPRQPVLSPKGTSSVRHIGRVALSRRRYGLLSHYWPSTSYRSRFNSWSAGG